MSLYRFKTYRTTYYFPDPVNGGEFLYGLYHPYNRFPMRLLAIKAYWWLFRHCKLTRRKSVLADPDQEMPFSKIMAMCPDGSVMSFNMGTPGPEQKMSMLGLAPDGTHFFAKFSTNEQAISLSRNEMAVLSALKGTGLAPELQDCKDGGDYVFFRTACVDGDNPKDVRLCEKILQLVLKINQCKVQEGELKTCLSHGDFTPWNLIVTPEGEYKMIDWELSAETELGYDLFTYITHVGALLSPGTPAIRLIDDNKEYVDRYFATFGIEDWIPYMKAFARRRIAYDKSKGELEHAEQIECLL